MDRCSPENVRQLFSRLTWLLVCAVLVNGCATSGAPPVEQRGQPPARAAATYEVQKGDTLYSIAWRYETNYQTLARINGIGDPYTIFVGQVLRLTGPARNTEAASVSSSGQTSANRPPPATAGSRPSGRTESEVKSASRNPVPATPVSGWQWPLSGRLVKSFGSDSLTRGITIDTGSEKAVLAAADGVVVYAGSGVRGYGNFLILKHSDLFLSAYAYNAELIAKEGDQVRMGQKIARSGEDQDGQPRLYFEVRKDGKPVDPVRYLPAR